MIMYPNETYLNACMEGLGKSTLAKREGARHSGIQPNMALIWPLLGLFLSGTAVAYFYLSSQLGSTSVHAVLLLLIRGCVTFKTLSLKPLAAQAVTLAQPQRLGGITIFSAEAVSLQTEDKQDSRAAAFGIVVAKPRLNLLGDSEGLLHVVSLLQDVGYLSETKVNKCDSGVPDKHAGQQAGPTVSTSQVHRASFEGEAFVSVAKFFLRDGLLDLPYDVGQIIGKAVKVKAALGEANVRRCSKELLTEADPEWWKRKHDATTNSGSVRYPIMLHLKSDNLQTDLTGWRTDTGFLLNEPIKSSVHFTPEVAQFALSRLHPLLGCAVSLQGSDHICSTLTPLDMHLPSEMMNLRLEPLKVILKTKSFVKGIINLFQIAGNKNRTEASTLEAWTSAIAADVYRSGIIVSKRMDMLLGHDVKSGKGLHISMWGTVDTGKGNRIDMVLGLPAHTLRKLGAKDIDEAFVFQVAVGGTAQAPDIDWLRAGKDLAEIILKSQVGRGLPFLKNVFRTQSERRKSNEAASVPPPSLPFPWEAFNSAVEIDKDSLLAKHQP